MPRIVKKITQEQEIEIKINSPTQLTPTPLSSIFLFFFITVLLFDIKGKNTLKYK